LADFPLINQRQKEGIRIKDWNAKLSFDVEIETCRGRWNVEDMARAVHVMASSRLTTAGKRHHHCTIASPFLANSWDSARHSGLSGHDRINKEGEFQGLTRQASRLHLSIADSRQKATRATANIVYLFRSRVS